MNHSNPLRIKVWTAALLFCSGTTLATPSKIDRHALVTRHNIVTESTLPASPAQVGNGEFAFGMDITGLQTFTPFNTLSQWSWHSFPLPENIKISDYQGKQLDTHGKMIRYEMEDPAHPEISEWLAGNPHRFNLGRIGFRLLLKDGTEAQPENLQNTRQETDLWSGLVNSRFMLEGVSVNVTTACDPEHDRIGVTVESDLIREGRLQIFFEFPYPTPAEFGDYLGDYAVPGKHSSVIVGQSEQAVTIERTMDGTRYYTSVGWDTPAQFEAHQNPHRFLLIPAKGNKLAFTCEYASQQPTTRTSAARIIASSRKAWPAFWNSGGAIDLSGSSDPRWKELERKIVLSQYLMRVNEAGSLPPQESGLVNNGWYGRFHFEMYWWHGLHYALWNRWDLLERSLHVYQDFLPTSIGRAAQMGRRGAKWPKCTGDTDREWPHPIHATLIWQQPHPIYFAEQDYRLHPTRETLEKWKDIVTETAQYMADYAYFDPATQRYVLGPPLYIVSENTEMTTTRNPAYELGYWRYGLRTAVRWRERLNLPAEPQWQEVLGKLSPLPTEDGVYVTHEGIRNMWTDFNFEHPALTGTFGMLPGDGVDTTVFRNTLAKVVSCWKFDHTWGWDFPMLAMAAARSGNPETAVEMLLHPAPGFRFDAHGLATGGPFPYFPSNGGLLTAAAMMAAGWDGAPEQTAPGFPRNGKWVVRYENLNKMQ